jgi:hypothetical protein
MFLDSYIFINEEDFHRYYTWTTNRIITYKAIALKWREVDFWNRLEASHKDKKTSYKQLATYLLEVKTIDFLLEHTWT